MGKYMRTNSKTVIGDVSLMDMPSTAGVRTRAKTLALQKAAVSCIQLRSRLLIKPTLSRRPNKNRVPPKPNKHCYQGANSSRLKVKEEDRQESEITVAGDFGIADEASFGENVMEIEGRERSTGEETPCNLIRDPETIRTPGSSTKRSHDADGNYRVQNSAPRHIPSTNELDEIFTEPEKQQQQLFIEKYNFDPVKEKPLPGRYEWAKVDGTKNVN